MILPKYSFLNLRIKYAFNFNIDKLAVFLITMTEFE